MTCAVCKNPATHQVYKTSTNSRKLKRSVVARCEEHKLWRVSDPFKDDPNNLYIPRAIDFPKLMEEVPQLELVPSLWVLELL